MKSESHRLTGRINVRITLFATVVVLVAGWPVYSFVSESVTGGVHDRGSYKEVDLKAMGNFLIDRRDGALNDVPARYRSLDGQKVLLPGLVLPTTQAGPHISEFFLQYSAMSCCIGVGPP